MDCLRLNPSELRILLGRPAAHRMHLDATTVLAVDLVVDGADAGRAADRDVVRPRLHQALHFRGQMWNTREKKSLHGQRS